MGDYVFSVKLNDGSHMDVYATSEYDMRSNQPDVAEIQEVSKFNDETQSYEYVSSWD